MGEKCNNSYKVLLQQSQEHCDFCDKIFHNRFQSIIHNASHIIIPLIKQKCCQCNRCHCYFTSPSDLHAHLETVHHTNNSETLELSKEKFQIKLNNVEQHAAGNKFKLNSIHNVNPERLDEGCHVKEKVKQNSNRKRKAKFKYKSNCNNKINVKESNSDIDCNLNKIFRNNTNDCGIEVDYNINEKFGQDTVKIKLEDTKNEVIYHKPRIDNAESIKSRLRFEGDDIFENNILNDLITDFKVEMFDVPLNEQGLLTSHIQLENDHKTKDKLKGMNQQVIHNGSNLFGTLRDNCQSPSVNSSEDSCIQIQRQLETTRKSQVMEPDIQESKYKSVHYSDLMKPGIFKCKYCFQVYPNRFTQIKHEMDHIKIKKRKPPLCTYCDRYIAGNYHNLHRHIRKKHPTGKVEKKHRTHKCTDCGLKYRNYLRHLVNYHPTDCPEDEDIERNICSADKPVKLMNVCDLCYAFKKVTSKCVLAGDVNTLGVRQKCEMCGKMFFSLKTVKLPGRDTYVRKETKRVSNEDRLKKLQHRLKKINRLNKFYTAVLFSLFLT